MNPSEKPSTDPVPTPLTAETLCVAPAWATPPAAARAVSGTTTATPPVAAARLERIGPYGLKRVLGEGGFGVVYLAEQASPKRLVALKVLRAGVAGPSVLSRFAHEAETLGLLQHPGIAQVYEAGFYDPATGETVDRDEVAKGNRVGLPFFAMEFVEGRTLTDHAAAFELSRAERLKLVMQVCEAVQHAHAKGVIHRDLKPANILVDESGRAKVLDFGVARVTTPDVAARTMQTDVGQMVGTLGYMSPEQVAADPREIDTRADVYALGATLYELLTGSPPHRVQGKLLHEATRIICDVPPARLSSVDRSLRGDLETIVAKALEKDKARRYQTATDMGADLGRYLNDEPIMARPPSTVYQAVKFAKRNKALVAGLGASIALLVGGVIASTYWAFRATRAEVLAATRADEAVAAQGQAEKERDTARREAAKATAVTGFLENTLTAANPEEKGRDIKVADLLDGAAKTLDKEYADKPEVAASLRAALGRTYYGLGLHEEARGLLASAAETFEKTQGADGADTVANKVMLARALRELSKFDEAIGLLTPLYERSEKRLGPYHELTLLCLKTLGRTHADQGKLPEALKQLSELCARLIHASGPDHRETLAQRAILGELLIEAGRNDEAAATLTDVHERVVRVFGEKSDEAVRSREALAQVYRVRGEFDRAIEMGQANLPLHEAKYGPEHPEYLNRRTTLARTMLQGGRFKDAIEVLRPTYEVSVRKLGAEAFNTLTAAGFLGDALLGDGQVDEAIRFRRIVAEGREKTLGPDHPQTLIGYTNLGFTLSEAKRYDEATAALELTLARREKKYGPDHGEVAVSCSILGRNEMYRGNLARAEELLRRAVAIRAKLLPEGSGVRGVSMSVLGEVLWKRSAAGGTAEAEGLIVTGAEWVLADKAAPAKNRAEMADRAARYFEAKGDSAAAAAWRAR